MRPNIIFVFSDQHRLCDVGYAGNKQVKTPFLDMMSQESCEFTYAISGMPVCCPYRATLMTGMYPLSHGVFLNDLCMDTGGPYLGELFRDNGYSTAYIGKWHIDGHGRSGYIPEERHRGFDFRKGLECTHDYNNSPYYSGNSPEKLYWEDYDAFAQTDCAVDYINSYDKEQPFFMILSYGPPHRSFRQNATHRHRRCIVAPLLRKGLSRFALRCQFFQNPFHARLMKSDLQDCHHLLIRQQFGIRQKALQHTGSRAKSVGSGVSGQLGDLVLQNLFLLFGFPQFVFGFFLGGIKLRQGLRLLFSAHVLFLL